MAKIIEAKAVISGEDRLSKVLDGINKRFKDLGKGARVSADLSRLNQELEKAQKGLLAIERLRNTQGAFSNARTRFRTAESEVGRIAKELEAARKAAAEFDGIKAFSKNSAIAKEIGDARKRVVELEGALRGAQREVKGSAAEFDRQTAAIKAAKRAAEEAGVSIRNLGEEEGRLKRKVAFTNEALARQSRLQGDGRSSAIGAAQGASAGARLRAGLGLGEAAGAGLSGAAAMRFGLGAAGIVGGAAMVGDGLRRAYGSSVSFERSMIEVGKATDTSGAELDAYGERLLKLARDTGKTKEELASMLSSAGFAGRPKEELMDFTEYASKATVAWQTGAEETGQALAEIGNIYEANQKRIEQIGDAINTMADNSASKETDLLEFMRRAGASSRQAGISAEKMLAFGAALKEVGVRNEVAATGFEALLNVMKLGEEFSKSAGKGLKELGVESTKMRKAFVAKPIETMVDLLNKLNKVADPLKKAEIMTNLFGKEYQDDISKLLNALPKLQQYLDLMGDAKKLAAGGVRLQFAQNLDKDVSKIDRATQAIDVLYKRIGDPIKIQVGGVAEQINRMVERLEEGDTFLQRIIKGLRGDGKDAGTDKPSEDGDPIGRLVTKLLEQLDPKFGKGKGDQERIDLERAAADEKLREREVLDRPGLIEARIRRQEGLAAEAKGATGARGSLLREQAKGADAEISRLKGELAQAWEAIGSLRAQQKRDGGAFGLDGPTGKPSLGIGPGRFGIEGAPSMPSLPSRAVPLPPGRPKEFGGIEHTIAEVKQPVPVSVTGDVKGQAEIIVKVEVSPTGELIRAAASAQNATAKLNGVIAANGPGSTGKSAPDAGKGGRD